jgi:pimeloyl-ACP methyl ester carboxylesterase
MSSNQDTATRDSMKEPDLRREESAEIPDRYLTVDGVKLRYRDTGSGEIPILLLHGLAASIEIWDPVVQELRKRHRVLALDLPGFGRSDKPDADFSPAYMSRVVRQFLTQLEVPKVTLIGHSYGGAVALRFAIDTPASLDRLVLVAPAVLGRHAHLLARLMTLPGLGEMLSMPSRAGTKLLFRLATHNSAAISDALIDESYRLAKLPGAQRSFLRTVRGLGNLRGQRSDVRDPILARLRELSMPTLLLWGKQDRFVPEATGTAGLIPGIRIELLDHCGHLVWLEQPERFNTLLEQFLPHAVSQEAELTAG